MKPKNPDYYLNLPWTYSLRKEMTPQGPFYLAKVNELRCFSDGATKEEALRNVEDALKQHIESELAVGNSIPEPVREDRYKGVITYRTTPELHYRLALEAERLHTSINKLIDDLIRQQFAT